MLTSLSIKNVVLIDHLNVEFKNGLCALTGETGAGKSILLDSLGLALGARSESRLVRKGSDQAQVIASFEIKKDHPALEILKNAELESDQTLILRRAVNAEGGSKAFINDQPVSAGLLKQVGEALVEVHGQFETQSLLDAGTHRSILDEYAGTLGALSENWQSWKGAEKELQTLKAAAQKSQDNEEYLRQSLQDLDALDPQQGEEEQLSVLRESLMHREQVLEALNVAYQALSSEDDPVRTAWGALDRVSDKLGEKGGEIIAALDRATSETQEALSAIQNTSSDLEHSEHSLETIDDCLHELRAQARKHDCMVDELPQARTRIAQELSVIENADGALEAAQKKSDKAKDSYIKAAEALRKKRTSAAVRLDGLVMEQLPPLKLEKATFITQIQELDEAEWGAHGMDRIRFLVATNPGADPGPLNKIASGGEMARFMLALKVVMAEVGCAQTLVFDEVDSGVGGSTADAVGERLALLAQNKQVMVVTHAPQLAARADHHLIVRKDGVEEVNTNVVSLDTRDDRQEEIARMLSGASITEEARAAANKLLETGT